MANERQAKDGTFYQQVGQDEWTPVTRQDKQGNVYKKVGADAWAILSENKPKEATAGDKGMAALEGFAKSSSMGTLPYLQAAGEVVTDKIADSIYGDQGQDQSFSNRVDKARERSAQIKQKAPGYSMAGEITGFIAPGAAVSKGVGAVGKALQIKGAASSAPLISRLASQSGRLAAEGAVFGAAYTPDTGFTDVKGRAEAAATGAAFGAAMPPAMYAGGKVLSAAVKAPGAIGKKILSSLGGVKEEVIERYLQNPERIRGAKTFDELYETTTKIVSQLGDDLDNAKIDFDSAKKHLDDVADGIKNSRVEGRDAALEQVTRAKTLLEESFKNQKAGLQSKASASNVEPMVNDALTNLKKKVSAGSKEAFDMLEDSAPAPVESKPISKFIKSANDGYDLNYKSASGKANLTASSIDEMHVYDETLAKFEPENPAKLEHIESFKPGQGKKILKEMERAAQQNGHDAIYLNASPLPKKDGYRLSKDRLVKFYKDNGYKVINDEGGNAVMYKELKNSVSEAPGAGGVSVGKTYESLISSLKDMSARGSDSAKQAVNKLKQYGDLIYSKGKTSAAGEIQLPAKEIKRIIQDIDTDVSSWNLAGGAYDDAYNISLKSLRRSLDEQLKTNFPEYKAKMASVAEDAKLLGQASERFGKPDRALSRLGGLDRTAAKYDLETVKALAAKEGGELPQAIDDMAKAQRTLKSPIKMEDMKRSLPEASALRDAEMKAAAAKRLAKPKFVKEAIEKNSANFKLKSAAEKLKAQKEVFARLKSFGEQGAENKLQQVARGRKFAEQQLRELSQYADEDLVEAVKAAQDAAAFDKTIFHGSRNVNLWALLGALGSTATGKGGVGAAAGGVFGGPIGIAIGGVVGAMMDNYGPRVTKQILDGVIKIKGPVSELAIMKMKVPENVKAELAKQFQKTFIAERIVNAAKSAAPKVAEEKPKGEDKWAADGFEKLKRHATPEERARLEAMREEIFNDPRKKKKMISASELKPGSENMQKIMREINSVKEE